MLQLNLSTKYSLFQRGLKLSAGKIIGLGFTNPVSRIQPTDNDQTLKEIQDTDNTPHQGTNGTTQKNTPVALRIPEPALIRNHHVSHFSPRDDKQALLFKLNEIWESGHLFSRHRDPDSNFYDDYIEELTSIVDAEGAEKRYFSELGNNYLDFRTKFQTLKNLNVRDLTTLQKAICLTQAIDLALLGVNITPVLNKINRAYVKATVPNGKGETRKFTTSKSTQGFRQELQAGWFLAKFIYQLEPSASNLNSFTHLAMLKTFNRNKHNPDGTPLRVTKEADIFTEDALVSIKSHFNDFNLQINDLFFMIVDDKDLNLRDKIKKIILIKCAENSNQFKPNFMSTVPYKDIKNYAINTGSDSIKKSAVLTPEDEKLLNRLVSNHGLDIYFIPSVNEIYDQKLWIEKYHEFISEKSKRENIA